MEDIIEVEIGGRVVRGEFLRRKINHVVVAIIEPFQGMKLERSWDASRLWDYPDYREEPGEDAAVELLRLMYEMHACRGELVEDYAEMQRAADDHWVSTIAAFETDFQRRREDDRGYYEAREAGEEISRQQWYDERIMERKRAYGRAHTRLREMESELLYRHLGELADAVPRDELLEYVVRWASAGPLPTERYREEYEAVASVLTSIGVIEMDR